jgi:hypothetical protein
MYGKPLKKMKINLWSFQYTGLLKVIVGVLTTCHIEQQ